MALTMSQGLLFIILFCATSLCLVIIMAYMAFLFVTKSGSQEDDSLEATHGSHPHAWRTKV